MQRLIRASRRRAQDERGATAVMFALLLVPMLGFAAIAVDVGALYAEKARLQVAADAAAIAVAQDCSRGNCGDMLATAQSLITANDGEGTAAHPVLSSDPLSVTVVGSTPQEHWFAPVLGHDSTAVSATATVGWGSPSAGTAVLPLTFSWCAFKAQTGGSGLPTGTTEHTVKLTKSDGVPDCTGPSGNVVPGGFGFLVADDGACEVTSAIEDLLYSSTGNTPPSGCDPVDFTGYLEKTVLLPIFDKAGGTGSGAWYHVYGYAAFTLTGYDFGGQFNGDLTEVGSAKKICGGNGSDRCVTGHFTRFVELSDAWNYSPDAPQMGSSILRLIR
jgi:Flp pilus assembly protein TadG